MRLAQCPGVVLSGSHDCERSNGWSEDPQALAFGADVCTFIGCHSSDQSLVYFSGIKGYVLFDSRVLQPMHQMRVSSNKKADAPILVLLVSAFTSGCLILYLSCLLVVEFCFLFVLLL